MSRDSPPPVFDAHAQQYDRELSQGLALTGESKEYYARGRVGRLAELLERAGARPERVLDFGCGTGGAIAALQAAFRPAAICGTDLSAASLQVARAENPEAVFAGSEEYPATGPFDLCYCNGVFHHIPPDERDDCLAALSRNLRPGGWLALFENNPLNPGTRLVMSRIPFDRDAIPLMAGEAVRRVRGAGFEIKAVEFLFFFPRSLAAVRRLERHLSRVPLGGQYLVLGRRTG